MDPPDERRSTQLDCHRQQRVEREQDRQRQKHRHAAARRVHAPLAVQVHQLRVHLLPGGIGGLELRVPLLDGLHLRLDLLHLPHRHDALVAQRADDDVDEDRQGDDRPAVVADEAVDPLERAQQRHREPREEPEVHRADQIRIDRVQDVEVLRAEEELARRRRLRVAHRVRHEVLLPVAGAFRGREGERRELQRLAALGGAYLGRQEVVILDAPEWKRVFVARFGFERARLQTRDLPLAEQDGTRRLVEAAAARVAAVADRWTPDDGRVQRLAVVLDRRRERHQEGRLAGIELERLPGVEAGGVAVLEGERAGPVVLEIETGHVRFEQGLRQAPGQRRIPEVEVERVAEIRWHAGGNQLERLAILVEVALEPPAPQLGAAVRKHGADSRRFDHDVALGGVGGQRLGRFLHGHGRRLVAARRRGRHGRRRHGAFGGRRLG